MSKWKFGLTVVLMTGVLAACNNDNNDDETPMEDQGASDLVTPHDDNGIDGINNDYNGSEGLYMNGDNANVDTPTSNKDYNGNNGATSNGGNNMNGAGGNNGEEGNNGTNRNGGPDAGIRGNDNNNNNNNNVLDDAANDVEGAADRIVDDGKDMVDDVENRVDRDTTR